jgi:DinB superfamily
VTQMIRDDSPVRALLRWQFQRAHELLDAEIDGLTAEAAHRRLPGMDASPGTRYAQVVLCEDLSVNGVLAAGQPLALSTWAARTGLSELPALATPTDWNAWSRRVRLDLAQLRPYARAVYAATDAYLATLPDEALAVGHGEQLAGLLSAILLTLAARRGEIGCLLAFERRAAASSAP